MGSKSHTARCSCGQLTAVATGEPARISICHCLECQRRTGSSFGAQVRFPASAVSVSGRSTAYARTADSGHVLTFHFCPVCGTTVHYSNDELPGYVGLAAGAFAGAAYWRPTASVYERTKHEWVETPDDMMRSQA